MDGCPGIGRDRLLLRADGGQCGVLDLAAATALHCCCCTSALSIGSSRMNSSSNWHRGLFPFLNCWQRNDVQKSIPEVVEAVSPLSYLALRGLVYEEATMRIRSTAT